MYKNEEIYRDIREKILNNYYKPNDSIESETALGRIYKANRHTIRKVTDRLADEGYITKNYKKPSTVNDLETSANFIKYNSLHSFIQKENITTKIMDFKVIEKEEWLSKIFNTNTYTHYYHIKRLRGFNGKSIQLEDIYMPVKLFPKLTKDDACSSLYSYIEKESLMKRKCCDRTLTATLLESNLQKIMKTDFSVGIKVITHGYLENGRKFEYSETIHVGTDFTIHQELK